MDWKYHPKSQLGFAFQGRGVVPLPHVSSQEIIIILFILVWSITSWIVCWFRKNKVKQSGAATLAAMWTGFPFCEPGEWLPDPTWPHNLVELGSLFHDIVGLYKMFIVGEGCNIIGEGNWGRIFWWFQPWECVPWPDFVFSYESQFITSQLNSGGGCCFFEPNGRIRPRQETKRA